MIYFDNAATSFPKPDKVISYMEKYIKEYGVSNGRSSHELSLKASRMLFECREKIGRLINCRNSERITFTLNATYALNMAMHGFLKDGDTVIVSPMEHNSVMRPLAFLQDSKAVIVKTLLSDDKGAVNLHDLHRKLSEGAELVIINHASNVTGLIQDISSISSICSGYRTKLLVDASQSIGSTKIDLESSKIDMMAFSGHKSLMGPTGSGMLYTADDINLKAIIQGGTGSDSESFLQPEAWPDRMESGTLNLAAISGLLGSLDFIEKTGLDNIIGKKKKLTNCLIEQLSLIESVEILPPLEQHRTAAISVLIKGRRPSEAAAYLAEEGICVRTGLHCAPQAHKTMGTYPDGTVRISPGYFNSFQDINILVSAIKDLVRE